MRFRFHRATNRGTPDFFPFGFERGVLFDGISSLSLPVFLFIIHKRQILYHEVGQFYVLLHSWLASKLLRTRSSMFQSTLQGRTKGEGWSTELRARVGQPQTS